ncbi:MAG: hypothetical protein Q7U12_16185, partial [Undibacterium sp.]|nr:hypothetical protein [Undibacterium sp.]
MPLKNFFDSMVLLFKVKLVFLIKCSRVVMHVKKISFWCRKIALAVWSLLYFLALHLAQAASLHVGLCRRILSFCGPINGDVIMLKHEDHVVVL